MFVNYRTKGFILKKEDRGEADQLLMVFTKDFGKLEILGKSIRKISSKLRSGVEIFYLSEIEFIQGKTYKTLTDAILIEKFENIRKDLKRLKILYRIAEVFDELVKEEEKDESLWELLTETFKQLNNLKIENYKLKIIYYYFLWNFFSILGYGLQLYHCVLCQRKLAPERLFFTPKEGGVICQKCEKKIKSINEISLETIKILRIILKKDWSLLKKIKIKKENLNSLKKITQEYYRSVFKDFLLKN